MSINLAPELEDLIHKKVESGRYDSPSDVVSKALRLLEEQEQSREQRLEEVRHKIALGLKDLDEGRHSPLDEKMLDEIKSEGRARLAAYKQNSHLRNDDQKA